MPFVKLMRRRMRDMLVSDRTANVQNPRRGAIIVLAALLMVPIFAFVAFSIDTGYMAICRTELQAGCDAAALAAANEISNGESEVKKTAKYVGKKNNAANAPIDLADKDIELGKFDLNTHTFTPTTTSPNAVRVTAHIVDQPLFFAPIIGHGKFNTTVQAIAMLNPRDICFAVDLSGSMNDDTEPCWATSEITKEFSPQGYPNVGKNLMKDIYSDLGFGAYPGKYEYLGKDLGVPSNDYAYAEMTDDKGPLSKGSIAWKYRIKKTDSESTRKIKAYSYIIDKTIRRLMPAAKPYPNSSNSTSYGYWEKYIDYVIIARRVKNTAPKPKPKPSPKPKPKPSPKPKPKPSPKPKPKPGPGYGDQRPGFGDFSLSDEPRDLGQVASVDLINTLRSTLGKAAIGAPKGFPRRESNYGNYWIPPSQDSDRIYRSFWDNGNKVYTFNNPNKSTFSSASTNTPKGWRNKIGYVTYVQFMMDWGRDRSPDVSNTTNAANGVGVKTQLSTLSPYCRYHQESTAGGTFNFPPREMPTHALRRSLIAALQLIKTQNAGSSAGNGDRVSIVTFDGLDAYHQPKLHKALTANYFSVMSSATTLQATSDIGRTTATEAGLILARGHLQEPAKGGQGRVFAKKVIVLLTDGSPNEWQSPASDVNSFVDSYNTGNPGNNNLYHKDYVWLNAPLMQASQFLDDDDGLMFSVGMGLGTNYDFMDKMARTATSDENGQSPRGSGNPAEYEQRLTQILERIIKHPGTRLVQ